jgi:Putative peptidoglycan binding domain
MSTSHIVKQGEHTTRIAKRYGFINFLTIWDDPENAALKELRKNPNVLFPGDRVFVPDKQLKKLPRPTGQKHRFVVAIKQLMLRIVIQNYSRKPISGTQCDLEVEGKAAHLVTDGNGQIEQLILPTAEIAKLDILNEEFSVLIGHLDPVEENSGLEARLNNLGYYVPPADSERDDDELRSAIEEFQRDYGLVPKGGRPSGVNDAATQAKLLEAHGC